MTFFRVLLLFLCVGQLSLAQENEQTINLDDTLLEKKEITEAHLEPYKTSEEFNYTTTEASENFLDKVMRWLNNFLTKFWESIFGAGTAKGFLYFVFKILPYLLLGFLLFLLIRFFLKVNSNAILTRAQKEGTIVFSEEEQIIKNEDIPALIQAAIQQHNYRLAIRYYYLLSLKFLTERDIITWEPQKTNEDYSTEISNPNIKIEFINSTKIYDYVWYGEFNVDAIKFETLKRPFENLNTLIKKS